MAFAQSELSFFKCKTPAHGQSGSGRPRTSRTVQNIDAVSDLALSQESATGTHKAPVRSQGNWHFAEVSGMPHTQRHSAKVPEETIEAWSEF